MKKLMEKMKTNTSIKARLLFIVFIVALVLLAPLQKVEIGQRGVLYNTVSGKTTSIESAGWHIVIPFFKKMVSYPINETVFKIHRDNKNWNNGIDASIVTPTKDNQEVSIDVTFILSIN